MNKIKDVWKHVRERERIMRERACESVLSKWRNCGWVRERKRERKKERERVHCGTIHSSKMHRTNNYCCLHFRRERERKRYIEARNEQTDR